MPLEPLLPPRPRRPDGALRRVGVEIEYAGPGCAETAALVRALYGGTVEQRDAFRFVVAGTRLGDFTVELDMSLAHPGDDRHGFGAALEEWVRAALATVGRLIMPYEVATPPLPIDRLGAVDGLVAELRRHAARGTRPNPLHAFGLHLNPEVASRGPGWILAQLRAFALLAPTLRAAIGVDLARRLSRFITPYPADYVRRIVDPAYRPDLASLIDDYLDANPTRNRELDLLPLFAHLMPRRMRRRVADPRVRPRPTFHYRLPDSRVDERGWSVVAEWNRWVLVERFAADGARLEAASRRFLAAPETRAAS
jgi:Putative amidoligase enzyme